MISTGWGGARRRLSRKAAILVPLLAVAACVTHVAGDDGSEGEDAFVVRGTSPNAGAYGTSVTVDGHRLSGAKVTAKAADGEVVTMLESTANTPRKDAGAAANDDRLTFRFAFPAEGEMTLDGPNGPTSIGVFTPTWSAGLPTKRPGATVLGAASFGASVVVFVGGAAEAGFLVFEGAAEPRLVPIEPAIEGASQAIVLDAAPTPVVPAANDGGGDGGDGGTADAGASSDPAVVALVTAGDGTLRHVRFDGTRAVATAYESLGGTYLGAGKDNEGIVVVTRTTDDKIDRYRAAGGALSKVGPSVPLPAASAKNVVRVAGNGNVVMAWGVNAGSTFDDKAAFYMSGLVAGATEFSAGRRVGYLDDVVQSLDADATGGVVSLSFCARDTDTFSTTARTVCGSAATVDGKTELDVPQGSLAGPGGRRIDGDTMTMATCADGIVLGQGTAGNVVMEKAAVVWPCAGVEVVAMARTSRGIALVLQRAGKLYVARPR